MLNDVIKHLRYMKQLKLTYKFLMSRKQFFVCCKPAYHLINYFKLLTAPVNITACNELLRNKNIFVFLLHYRNTQVKVWENTN